MELVLVVHSYRGMVASNVSTERALVSVGAFAPDAGESATTLSARFEDSTDRYHAQFAADSSPADAAVMAATQRPIRQSALGEPSADAAWRRVPSWFLFGDEDRNTTAAIPEVARVVEVIEEAASVVASTPVQH